MESWNFLNRDLLNSILVPIWYFITDPQGAIYTRNTPNMKQFEINICHCNFLLENIDESMFTLQIAKMLSLYFQITSECFHD